MYDQDILDELDAVLDRVCGEAASLSDGESIERLHHALARLEAAATVASAAFDAGGEWLLESRSTHPA